MIAKGYVASDDACLILLRQLLHEVSYIDHKTNDYMDDKIADANLSALFRFIQIKHDLKLVPSIENSIQFVKYQEKEYKSHPPIGVYLNLLENIGTSEAHTAVERWHAGKTEQ